MRHNYLWMILVAFVLPVFAHADNLLGVAPLRTVLTDMRTNDIITVTNRSVTRHTYKIVLQDQIMTDKGNVVYTENFPYSAKRMLRFMPSTVRLEPGQRQNIRVMFTQPAGLADGEYHTHMLFDEIVDNPPPENDPKDKLRVNLSNLYSIGLPIIIQRGNVSSTLTMRSAKLVSAEENRGQKGVAVTLERKGNAEATGLIKVIVEGAPTNDSIVVARNMHMYREVDKVTIMLPFIKDAKIDKNTKFVALMEQYGKVVAKVKVEN